MTLFLDFSLITGILVTLFILFFLIKKKNKNNAQKLLISIFVLMLLALICYYSYLHKIYVLLLGTYVFVDAFDVLIGPLLWVYVNCIINSPLNSINKNKKYFVYPIVSILFISLPSMLLMINGNFDKSFLGQLSPYLSFEILYSLGFTAAAYYKILRFQKLVKHNYSNLENKDLNWVKVLLIGVMGIAVIDISTSIYEFVIDYELLWNIGYLTVLPGILLLVYLGYYGISQGTILVPDFLIKEHAHSQISSEDANSKEIKRYTYDIEEMKVLKTKLFTLMNSERPYLMEDLTLPNLSKMLSTSDKKLSNLLNQQMNISFYDYINGFRVEAVKEKLKDIKSNQYTLLAIAYDCGFQSKTSFNRVFKKITGVSPSEYKKTVEIGANASNGSL